MSIRVSITNQYSDGESTDVNEFELETDAPYSPDIADDLARQVTAMRSADRLEMETLAKEADKE